MKFTSPAAAAKFQITSAAVWPSIVFTTDATGPHGWKWAIEWDTFKASGSASTAGNTWDAKSVVADLGGTLTVTATAGKESAAVKVEVLGTNPTAAEATAYLATKPDSGGFDAKVQKESGFKQFRATGLPVMSFDRGFGMCQLTSPAPTAAQVWNWKKNLDGGLALFAVKVSDAKRYLATHGTYTADQLKYEAVCRWNGGSYHEWDAAAKAWVRKTNILCDTKTGNIGWDTTDAENAGKTEAELHKRDAGNYGTPKAKGPKNKWLYSGVCYADALLG